MVRKMKEISRFPRSINRYKNKRFTFSAVGVKKKFSSDRFKGLKKKATKGYAKASKGIQRHVNPDLLSGEMDFGFDAVDFCGFNDIDVMGFDVSKRKRRKKKR